MISDFFSKFDRFEGQCQRGPPKGSPSSPVIFHRTWYWKWSISTQGILCFGPWDQISGLSDRSASLLRTCRSVRKSGNLVVGPIRPSEPEIGSGRQKSDLAAKVPKSGNPRKSWKSRFSQKSRLFRKSRDFCEILDFRIAQDFRTFRTLVCTYESRCRFLCAYCCQKQRPTSYALHVRTCNHTLTHIIRVKGKLMTCINLVLDCTILDNRALWK